MWHFQCYSSSSVKCLKTSFIQKKSNFRRVRFDAIATMDTQDCIVMNWKLNAPQIHAKMGEPVKSLMEITPANVLMDLMVPIVNITSTIV